MSFEIVKTITPEVFDMWADSSVFFFHFALKNDDTQNIEGYKFFSAPVVGGPVMSDTGVEAYTEVPASLVTAYAAFKAELDAFAAQFLADDKCNPA